MTAVEYLMDKLFDPSTMVGEQLKWFEQAKEMEKQQLNKAWQDGAETAQSDAAKEIENNYVSRVSYLFLPKAL